VFASIRLSLSFQADNTAPTGKNSGKKATHCAKSLNRELTYVANGYYTIYDSRNWAE
jgi:hypothetical protein